MIDGFLTSLKGSRCQSFEFRFAQERLAAGIHELRQQQVHVHTLRASSQRAMLNFGQVAS